MSLLWKAFPSTDQHPPAPENLLLQRVPAIRLSQDTFVTNHFLKGGKPHEESMSESVEARKSNPLERLIACGEYAI